jgi:hypothetical protein
MTTWADLLANLRTDLKDTSLTPRWTDAQLLLWTKDAVRDYSTFFPLLQDRVALTLSGTAYPLPTDFVKVVDVECPLDRFLEQAMRRPGIRLRTRNGQPTHYYISGGSLYLNGTPLEGAEVLLTYDALHPLPVDENDTAFAFTISEIDEELLRLYVKAKASEQVRTQQSNLDRFTPGSGRRDDNPLLPEVDKLMQEYRFKIAERIGGGTILLWRPGRSV